MSERTYSAVLCETCLSMKKTRCFLCNNQGIYKKDFEVRICDCCVSSKRVECVKCKRGIMGMHIYAYYCEGCRAKKEGKCGKCNESFGPISVKPLK